MTEVGIGSAEIARIRLKESAAPGTPASGYGYAYAKADGLYYKGDDGVEIGPISAGVEPDYPVRAHWFHDTDFVVSGNAILALHASSQNYGFYGLQNTPADGDTFLSSALLAAGSYTIKLLCAINSASGSLDIFYKHVDDVSYSSLATKDFYSGSVTLNYVLTATFTLGANGKHLFKFVVNGKNASSSDYYIYLTKVDVFLTAGDS